MVNALITVVVAALAYTLCIALGLAAVAGAIAAVLILLSGFPNGRFGSRARR